MEEERSNVNCADLTTFSFVIWFAEFMKRIAGHFPLSDDSNRFELYCEMSIPIKTFIYVCSLVMEPMSKSSEYKCKDTDALTMYDKVAIAIRRLKSGKSLDSIGAVFKAHSFTADKVTRAFVTEEWKVLSTTRKPKRRPSMILACCILHNIVIDMNDEGHQELSLSRDHNPGYLQETAESIGETSADFKEKLSLYLSGKLKADVLLDIELAKYYIRPRS